MTDCGLEAAGAEKKPKKGLVISGINHCKNLEELCLKCCSCDPPENEKLFLESIRAISGDRIAEGAEAAPLSFCGVSDKLLESLECKKSIEAIDLSGCFSLSRPQFFGLVNLRKLSLANCNLENADIKFCNRLYSLDLSGSSKKFSSDKALEIWKMNDFESRIRLSEPAPPRAALFFKQKKETPTKKVVVSNNISLQLSQVISSMRSQASSAQLGLILNFFKVDV